jgi:hypothetical protein
MPDNGNSAGKRVCRPVSTLTADTRDEFAQYYDI